MYPRVVPSDWLSLLSKAAVGVCIDVVPETSLNIVMCLDFSLTDTWLHLGRFKQFTFWILVIACYGFTASQEKNLY